MLGQFQLYSKVILLYIYIYPLFFRLFSHVITESGHYRVLSRSLWTVQQVLINYLFISLFCLLFLRHFLEELNTGCIAIATPIQTNIALVVGRLFPRCLLSFVPTAISHLLLFFSLKHMFLWKIAAWPCPKSLFHFYLDFFIILITIYFTFFYVLI